MGYQLKLASPTVLEELCSTGLEHKTFGKNDDVFRKRIEAKHVLFVALGSVAYSFTRKGREEKQFRRLMPGQWCSEYVLWMPLWKHVGDMKALSHVDITSVSSQRFFDTIPMRPAAYFEARSYAIATAVEVERWASFDRTTLTDLPIAMIVRDS